MLLPMLTLTSAVMYCVHIAVTPPIVVRSSEKAFSAENPYVLLFCLRTLDIASSILSLIEILLLSTSSLAANFSQSSFIVHLYDLLSKTLLVSPVFSIAASPIRVIAGLTIIAGSLLRWWCYREMGRQYTFRVTVLKNHSLVTTGPYGFIRHPGYSGGILLIVALPFWHASQGGWVCSTEIGRGSKISVWPTVAATFAALGAPVVWISARRAAKEDALMRRKFGKIWEEWEKAVPYKFIPGVF